MADDRAPSEKADDEEALKATGAAVGGGLGCLTVAMMPWIVIVGVIAIIAVAWFVGRAME